MPLQVWLGLCGSRNLAGLLRRALPANSGKYPGAAQGAGAASRWTRPVPSQCQHRTGSLPEPRQTAHGLPAWRPSMQAGHSAW